MRGSRGARGHIRGLLRRTRWGLLAAAVAASCAALFLFVDSVALGLDGEVCQKDGDMSVCVQWGIQGVATTLWWKNTAPTGGQTISSFTFAAPSGTVISGTAGNLGCKPASPPSNQIACDPTEPGQQASVTLLAQSPIPVGSAGTFTFSDGAGNPQPPVTANLQSSSIATSSTNSSSSTSETTSTTTTECTPVIRIRKAVYDYSNPRELREEPPRSGSYTVAVGFRRRWQPTEVSFAIFAANESDCDASNVTVLDEKQNFVTFEPGQIVSGPPATVTPADVSTRYKLTIVIPSLPAHSSFEYEFPATLYYDPRISRLVNTAQVLHGNASTVFLNRTTDPATDITRLGAHGVDGAADEGIADVVWLAIQAITNHARRASADCSWLTTAGQFETLPCSKVVWLTATGTKSWHLRFARPLPAGRYLVFAMALGRNGLSADPLTAKAGDAVRFTVP